MGPYANSISRSVNHGIDAVYDTDRTKISCTHRVLSNGTLSMLPPSMLIPDKAPKSTELIDPLTISRPLHARDPQTKGSISLRDQTWPDVPAVPKNCKLPTFNELKLAELFSTWPSIIDLA